MTAKKQSTKKGGTKGKAEGSKGKKRATVKDRARAIVADLKGYDDETRHAIRNSLDENGSNLAELVGRAESGEQILDVSRPISSAQDAEQFKADAVAYAKKAYDDALAHYEANHNHPPALSRLAVVYDETEPEDFHVVVTLPGYLRDSSVDDEQLRKWVTDADLLARTLEHPECSEAFRKAFGSIFTEHILDGSDISWTTSAIVRVTLPLALVASSGSNHTCDDRTTLDVLVTLSSDLVSNEVARDVRAALLDGK